LSLDLDDPLWSHGRLGSNCEVIQHSLNQWKRRRRRPLREPPRRREVQRQRRRRLEWLSHRRLRPGNRSHGGGGGVGVRRQAERERATSHSNQKGASSTETISKGSDFRTGKNTLLLSLSELSENFEDFFITLSIFMSIFLLIFLLFGC